MLVYNHSHDGGTFEEATGIQRFQYWLDLRQQALFQIEFYLSLDMHSMATRYFKLMNYIENKMRTINF